MIDWLALYAQNEAGWLNLCRLVSAAHLDRPLERDPHVAFADLEGATEGLIALTGAGEGALVRLPAETGAPDGTVGKLHVHLNETLAEINMEIKVVHGEGRYAGLHCLAIDIDSVTHLRRLVELNLGDPALLDRELSALIVA